MTNSQNLESSLKALKGVTNPSDISEVLKGFQPCVLNRYLLSKVFDLPEAELAEVREALTLIGPIIIEYTTRYPLGKGGTFNLVVTSLLEAKGIVAHLVPSLDSDAKVAKAISALYEHIVQGLEQPELTEVPKAIQHKMNILLCMVGLMASYIPDEKT